MKSGASDRLWRPICSSYRSPLEGGNVEFLVSSGNRVIVTGETRLYPSDAHDHAPLLAIQTGDLFSEVESLVSLRGTAAANR